MFITETLLKVFKTRLKTILSEFPEANVIAIFHKKLAFLVLFSLKK